MKLATEIRSSGIRGGQPARIFLLAMCAGMVGFTPAGAQETPPVSGVQILGISAASGEITEEMREKMAAGAASVLVPSGGSLSMLNPLGGVDPNDRSQLFNLLSNPSVRQELKLTDEQSAGVQQIVEASTKRSRELIARMLAEQSQQGGNAIRLGGADFRALRDEAAAQAETAIEEILLPEQMKRIRQLAYQIEVAQQGLGEALLNGRLGAEIEVHENQKQHLSDKAAEIEADARAAIANIKARARGKLLAELTPDQRQAAEERLGDYFDYEELSLAKQLRQSIRSQSKPAGAAAAQPAGKPQPK